MNFHKIFPYFLSGFKNCDAVNQSLQNNRNLKKDCKQKRNSHVIFVELIKEKIVITM